jgi:hypothetical protein
MSSWYVWASVGMYPETPGAPVLVLGAPIFAKAEIDVPGRPLVTINAPGASTSAYVRSVSVGGQATPDAWLSASLVDGQQSSATNIAFTLASSADTSWAAAAADAPPSYEAGTLQFPPGRVPATLVPTGPNLLGSAPTGQLDWQGPVELGVGPIPGAITPATTPQGASAVEWTEASAGPNSWIWADPQSNLTGGDYYQVSITLQGEGDVYLDFYDGQEDLTSEPLQLTSSPQTFTLDVQAPATANTHLQVRTATTGPIDLYASAANVQLLTVETKQMRGARHVPHQPLQILWKRVPQ